MNGGVIEPMDDEGNVYAGGNSVASFAPGHVKAGGPP